MEGPLAWHIKQIIRAKKRASHKSKLKTGPWLGVCPVNCEMVPLHDIKFSLNFCHSPHLLVQFFSFRRDCIFCLNSCMCRTIEMSTELFTSKHPLPKLDWRKAVAQQIELSLYLTVHVEPFKFIVTTCWTFHAYCSRWTIHVFCSSWTPHVYFSSWTLHVYCSWKTS